MYKEYTIMGFQTFIPLSLMIGFNSIVDCREECSYNPSLESEDCRNARTPETESCLEKVHRGLCESGPDQEFMFENCVLHCIQYKNIGAHIHVSLPNTEPCFDSVQSCEQLSQNDQCYLNSDYMLQSCAKTCRGCVKEGKYTIGLPQKFPEDVENSRVSENAMEDEVVQFLQFLRATNKYMTETVMTKEEYSSVRQYCRNTDELCTALAMEGRCEKPDDFENLELNEEVVMNYQYMIAHCSPACQTCHELILTKEEKEILDDCTPDVDTNIFKSGDINNMFERIVGDLPYPQGIVVPQYTANIFSRPLNKKHKGKAVDELGFHVGPWIITLENFLTSEECDRLVELGAESGYSRSTLEDGDDDEGELAYRTSTNAWCQDDCYNDPVVQGVIQKIENTTGIPDAYSEYLQLLKYVPGQYYKEHHDWTYDETYKKYDVPGPRLITFFMYLNDVEEGGATRFTDLFGDDTGIYLDVEPKKGSALVWPSMTDADLSQLDERTYHEALKVGKGLKYGANAWLHIRDFKNDECDYEGLKYILRIGNGDSAEFEEEEEHEDDFDEEGEDVEEEE